MNGWAVIKWFPWYLCFSAQVTFLGFKRCRNNPMPPWVHHIANKIFLARIFPVSLKQCVRNDSKTFSFNELQLVMETSNSAAALCNTQQKSLTSKCRSKINAFGNSVSLWSLVTQVLDLFNVLEKMKGATQSNVKPSKVSLNPQR